MFFYFKGCPLGGCLAACSCTSAPCMGAEKLNGSPPQCGTAVGMLDLVRDAFARPTNNFPQTGPCGPVFCPVLCSEGPSMAVTCSAHAVTHVKVHHGPPPGHWNGRWRRGTTLKIWHSAKIVTRGCGLCTSRSRMKTGKMPIDRYLCEKHAAGNPQSLPARQPPTPKR